MTQPGSQKIYVYQNAEGVPSYEVVRTEPKSFRQRQVDGHGGHSWNLHGVERVPYHLPQLLERKAKGHTVFTVEGEKDVESTEAIGFCTTTNAGGAAWKYTPEFIEHFRGAKRIAVVPDCDEPGRKAALERATLLSAVSGDVRIVDLAPERDDGFDVSDWIKDGGTAAELKALVESAPRFVPVVPVNPQALGEPRWTTAFEYPTLGAAALHGLAGDFVRILAPHTEADPAAILVHTLCAFGCAVGPGPMVLVESSEHPARLNALIVGETARGRKGTAKDRVHYLFRQADDEWISRALISGLASGEGLINALKDRDEGEVVEKRVLVSEAEFARVIAAASRDGSILSAVIRDAWDSGRLQNLTRKEPLKAHGCHVSIVADITAEELRMKLSTNEIANGFLNRFLIVSAKRAQKLPHGGSLTDFDFAPIARRLHVALEAARPRRRVTRTEAADRWWERWYHAVPDEGGLLGAVTARAEAQMLRLSLVYALLDGAEYIDIPHLVAAEAVWNYAHASAQYVFGESLGDPNAQKFLDEARDAYPEGLDGAAQDRATNGRRTAAIRDSLVKQGLIRVEEIPGGGRPKVIAFAVPSTPADKADKADKLTYADLNPLYPLNPQGVEDTQAELSEALI